MAVALHGNLKDFGIAEVFQLIGQQRKTGLLEIKDSRSRMCLAFDEGAVVWATPMGQTEYGALGEMLVRCGLLTREVLARLLVESEQSARSLPSLVSASGLVNAADIEQISDLLTQETIFEVLRWTSGSFHFSAQPVQHDRPSNKLLAAEQILMDGLRMVDEWRTFADVVPSLDAVFRRSGRFEVFRQQISGSARRRLAQAESVFRLIDGRLSGQRVIDLSRLGTFEGTRILAELREAGIIEPIESRVRPARTRSSAPVGEHVRWWLAAAFPIAILSLVVSMSFRVQPVAMEEGVFPIRRAPIQQARAAFETRRIRHALEAHRFLWGDWPQQLSDVARTGLVDADSLAAAGSPAYYYSRTTDGPLVLAPKR